MQALLIAQSMQIWIKDWSAFTGPMFWYMIRDEGNNPYVRDDNFGLLRRNFTSKPAYNVFKQQLQG